MSEKTPHIVLNFLDYIIWKNNQDKYKDFVFEFRNSIEHWYPQNPSEGTIPQWNDDKNNSIDRFGNLCLVQRASIQNSLIWHRRQRKAHLKK